MMLSSLFGKRSTTITAYPATRNRSISDPIPQFPLYELLFGSWYQGNKAEELFDEKVEEFSLEPIETRPSSRATLSSDKSTLDWAVLSNDLAGESLYDLREVRHVTPSRKSSSACSTHLSDVCDPARSSNLSQKCLLSLTDSVSLSTSEVERKASEISQTKKETSESSNKETNLPEQILAFESQKKKKSYFATLICQIIDRKPLKPSEVESLDSEDLTILLNFANVLLGSKLETSFANNMESFLMLNSLLTNSCEKKKRNEERIKYTFKRVNKSLLKEFCKKNNLDPAQEVEAQKLFVQAYFGTSTAQSLDRGEAELTPDLINTFGLLFKPTNIYRKDLKRLFSQPSYKASFTKVLNEDYLTEFLPKRLAKVEAYVQGFKEDLYFSNDKSDTSLLARRIKRLPWSYDEVIRGQKLMQQLLQE